MTKIQVGVDVVGADLAIGPITIAVVGVDSNFFRQYEMLMKSEDERHINLMKKHMEHLYIHQISVEEFKATSKRSLVAKAIIESLNTLNKFWTYDIKINLPCLDRKEFEILLLRHTPVNLRSIDIQVENWQIETNCQAKIVQLANTFARFYQNKALQDVALVYGDFGTGEITDQKTKDFLDKNQDCPHIRR